jgi:hypothetical protein
MATVIVGCDALLLLCWWMQLPNASLLTVWPEFHNGVAAGLRVRRGSTRLTRSWINQHDPEVRRSPISNADVSGFAVTCLCSPYHVVAD